MKEESERVVKTAAQLIKNAINHFEHETVLNTNEYPTADDTTSPGERICT